MFENDWERDGESVYVYGVGVCADVCVCMFVWERR